MSAERKNRSLPGGGLRLLSFLPTLNWLALIFLGVGWKRPADLLCGLIYGAVTFAHPPAAVLMWILGIVHYSIAVSLVKSEGPKPKTPDPGQFHEKKQAVPEVEIQLPEPSDPFAHVEIPGEPEWIEPIPVAPEKDITPVKPVTVLSAKERFLRDMKKYEGREGKEAPFVPFGDEKPLYESMSPRQQAWYFYWRSRVRGKSYPDTDVGYIWLYTFELLSGCGWQEPAQGYEKLLSLWTEYRQRYPGLDGRMLRWLLDFAWKHGLSCRMPEMKGLCLPLQLVLRDMMIEACSSAKPLKLPFLLVDALCEYPLTGSKFYKDGHGDLVEEAIPRVVALTDAALLKQKNKGLLAVYGPARTRKQSHILFADAICPDSDQHIVISVRGYTSSQKLRGFINMLVRFSENVLRSICAYPGRLRGVELDPELAALVETFLRKEYGAAGKKDPPPKPRQKLQLDFDNIAQLRAQADEVRDALEVAEDPDTPKVPLTDLQAVAELVKELDSAEAELMDLLHRRGWEMEYTPGMEQTVESINAKAIRLLACALLVREGDSLLAEDDYRDELNHIYAMKQQKQEVPPAENPEGKYFDPGKLSPPMAELMAALSQLQQQAVRIVLLGENVQGKLAELAEEAMTMPEILIDEINDLAAQYLDDILIDGFGDVPEVLEQYADELKKAMI